jgi:hypothetical protein
VASWPKKGMMLLPPRRKDAKNWFPIFSGLVAQKRDDVIATKTQTHKEFDHHACLSVICIMLAKGKVKYLFSINKKRSQELISRPLLRFLYYIIICLSGLAPLWPKYVLVPWSLCGPKISTS